MSQKVRAFVALAFAFAVLSSITDLPAATITGVTIEDFSSELGAPSFSRLAVNTINGSGLTGPGHGTTPEGTMWLSHGTFRAPNDPLPAQITFDLGAKYVLNSMHVWNYNEAGNFRFRGANLVEILAAETEGGPFVSFGNVNFSVASGAVGDLGSSINLAALDMGEVRLLRFNILSNHGGDAEFAGLSEVQFDGQFVPEPAAIVSWMLLGLSCIAVCAWRRSRRSSASA